MPEGLLLVVWSSIGLCMGCGLGWFVGSKFLLRDGLGWVGSVAWWVGLKKLDSLTTVGYWHVLSHAPKNIAPLLIMP